MIEILDGKFVVCRHIYLNDLMRFLREDQAVKTMSLLVGSPGDEKVSKGALKAWVVRSSIKKPQHP